MRENTKRGRRGLVVFGAWLLMLFGIWGTAGITALAQENSFVIEASRLPANEETYDIQLSVENLGTDWEGTVRLMVDEEYRAPSAYDTIISLPQGSKKQFVVKVPVNSIEDTDGTIRVTLWDNKSKKCAEKEFNRFLKDDMEALYMGILSDHYSSLTYLDLGGERLYFYGDEYPIKLVELNQDNLLSTLDSLEFLVIDAYNTGVLTDEERKAIELWNHDGGILLVGTGSYAEDTLSGLGDDYLGIECQKVYEIGELNQYIYDSEYVNLAQVPIAELYNADGRYSNMYLSNAMVYSCGDGAVGVLPYSLSEMADVDSTFYQNIDQLGFTMNLVEELSGHAGSRYNNTSNQGRNHFNYLRRMLRMIGSVNSPLHFGVLKFIVIAYVIFVGPVLYIILRVLKKREMYWLAVPGTALVGIVLIFLAGRGFEVVDTRVYGVATHNLSTNKDNKSYLYCFDAKNREWQLQLADGYDYAGSLNNDNYNYSEDEDIYYHHMKKEGERLSFGIKPSSNFEDSFFFAGKTEERNVTGTIELQNITADFGGISGVITNATNKDFRYYALIANDMIYVYDNLPAGEKSNLYGQIPVFTSYQKNDIWYEYMYNFLNDIKDDEDADTVAAAAALGVGVCSVYTQEDADAIFVIGVTEDWENIVDDECSEISYGCLYVIE